MKISFPSVYAFFATGKKRAIRLFSGGMQAVIRKYSLHGNREFFDTGLFPWVPGLEAAFFSIPAPDTHLHQVVNSSKEGRVVLFIDFKRPLPPFLDFLNGQVIKLFNHSGMLKTGHRNRLEWEKAFHA